ncbi:MAG: hypothetical protein WCP46_09475, partial [Alphaproteobacteria bacterium]
YPELICGVEVCIDKISKRSFEQSPYLTQDYDNDRNMRLLAKNFEVNGESDEESISTASDPWFFAGQQFLNKHNYIKSIKCYQRSGSIMALHNIGILYEEGQVDDKPNYQEAAKYYLLSNSQNSLINLGILHCQGKLSEDGEPNYHEAVKCYELSEDPDSLCNAGVLYAGDKLGSPNYKKAEELYIRSKKSLALFNLGYLYHIGKLSVSGQPDYHKAVEWYAKSGTSDALFNLGGIHLQIFGNFKEATACFMKSGTIDAKINVLLLHRDHSDKLGVKIDTHALNNSVHEEIRGVSTTEQLYFQGRLNYLNEQYEEALLCFSHALSKGYEKADCWLKNTEKALEIKQMEEKLAVQPKVDSNADSNTAEHAQDQSYSKQEADIESDDDIDDDLDIGFASSSSSSSSSNGAASTSVKAYKRSLNSSEKIARKKAKLQREIAKAFSHKMQFKSAQRIIDSPDTAEVVGPLTTAFVNDSVKTEYEARLPRDAKLARLMEDIWNKPWATEGEGKPEVLIGKFMGHKGCLSRRLDGEDRLFYKVTGPREILILAC